MAISNTDLLSVALLILTSTQGCRGEPSEDTAFLVNALAGVGEAIECFGDTTQEGLLLHKQNSQDLHALPDMVLQLKEQVLQQNENINLMKKEFVATQRADKLTEEIQALKQKLEKKQQLEEILNENIKVLKEKLTIKDETVEQLTEENAELKSRLADNDEKMQDQSRLLLESEQLVKQLESTMEQLNKTVDQQKPECSSLQSMHQHQQRIKDLVQTFARNSDWADLRRGLEAVLDRDSEVYQQLQTISHSDSWRMYHIGTNGDEQLAELLMCAGMSPNKADDSDGDTILQGAAAYGKLGMVRLLLRHGVDVDTRGNAGRTPLMRAVEQGYMDVVRELVQAGASTVVKNSSGYTALQLSRSPEVSHYLEQFPH